MFSGNPKLLQNLGSEVNDKECVFLQGLPMCI